MIETGINSYFANFDLRLLCLAKVDSKLLGVVFTKEVNPLSFVGVSSF